MGRNQRLEVIYLGCNRIQTEGAAALARALEENSTVTGLWLKRNPLGHEGLKRLARMLEQNHTLRVLDLVNTVPEEEGGGWEELLGVLTDRNRSVERLYLGGNNLTVQTATLLGRLLRKNSRIRALLLNVNRLGDAGVEALAEGVASHQGLEELGLASNGISGPGVTALLTALRTAPQPALTELDLGYSRSTRVLGARANALGDCGAAALAGFIESNPPLRFLDLRGNGITGDGRARLAGALQKNDRLQWLHLDGSPDPEIAAKLTANRAARPPAVTCRDLALIRSVYRGRG